WRRVDPRGGPFSTPTAGREVVSVPEETSAPALRFALGLPATPHPGLWVAARRVHSSGLAAAYRSHRRVLRSGVALESLAFCVAAGETSGYSSADSRRNRSPGGGTGRPAGAVWSLGAGGAGGRSSMGGRDPCGRIDRGPGVGAGRPSVQKRTRGECLEALLLERWDLGCAGPSPVR